MITGDILGFLLPEFGDPLQLTFFLIIFVMVGATIAGAHRTARPDAWERKWSRGAPDDHLDIEHGSVTDLWHAVATAPEKLAEIMPGLLLVVGLLGTFLGLGLALNNASSILGHANLADPGAAADSMQNLLGMLQGLGTKFKTSTWGILSFVLLKIWSEATRFEEKRLAWVIGKVKAELELRKRAEAQARQERQDAMVLQIGGVARHVIEGFGQQMAGLIKSNETLHLQQIRSNESLHLQQLAQLAKVEQAAEGVRSEVVRVQAGTEAIGAAMSSFTESTKVVVGNMDDAAQRMASGADKVGAGASELVGAIGAFQTQFTGVLDSVRKDLSTAINDMSAQAAVTLKEGSGQLKDATTEISSALRALSADVKETMSKVDASINKALVIQQKAAEEFILSNGALNMNITETTGTIEKLAKPIESGLQAVSTANLKMRTVADAVQSSTESLTTVVQAMDSLPKALEPLTGLVDEHRSLLALLRPLGETVKVQQAMLALLEEIQRDRASAQILGRMPVDEQDVTSGAGAV